MDFDSILSDADIVDQMRENVPRQDETRENQSGLFCCRFCCVYLLSFFVSFDLVGVPALCERLGLFLDLLI